MSCTQNLLNIELFYFLSVFGDGISCRVSVVGTIWASLMASLRIPGVTEPIENVKCDSFDFKEIRLSEAILKKAYCVPLTPSCFQSLLQLQFLLQMLQYWYLIHKRFRVSNSLGN